MDCRPEPDSPVSVEPDQPEELVAVFGRYVAPLSAVPATPRAETRSRSPIASSSGESGDAEAVLAVSVFEYIDIRNCRFHKLLLRRR